MRQEALSKRYQSGAIRIDSAVTGRGKEEDGATKWDLYDIFCAILYLLKNAATWRALPGDFPSPSTVRYYFDHWTQNAGGRIKACWSRH